MQPFWLMLRFWQKPRTSLQVEKKMVPLPTSSPD
jgi:hypothetical protein